MSSRFCSSATLAGLSVVVLLTPTKLPRGFEVSVGDCHIGTTGALPCLDSHACVLCSMDFLFLQQARPSKCSQQSQLVNIRKPNYAQRMNGSIPGLLEPKLETGTRPDLINFTGGEVQLNT